MYMHIGIPVRRRYLFIINFTEPVIGSNGSAVREYQSSHRIRDCRILLHTPVCYIHITIDEILVIEECRIEISDLFALFPVQDIRFRDIRITSLYQHIFDAVLYILYRDHPIFDLWLELSRSPEREKIYHGIVVVLFLSFKSLCYRRTDFGYIELRYLPVSLKYLVHF